jgi:hypothetical protein
MPHKQLFAKTIMTLGLTASLFGWVGVQAADPAPSADKPAESQSTPAKKDLPFPNSSEWSTATEREKLAYLLGIMNMALVEYQLSGPNPKHRTTVARMVKALDGMTLRQILEKVDAYYKANPDKQQQTVFEVIWFELVAPNVKKG